MICYGCGSEKYVFGDVRCKAKDMECYKCGTIGHSSYVCRKGQRQSNPQYNRGQRPQHVNMADERRDHGVINDKLPMFPRREPKRVTDARRNDNISKSKMKKYADRKARRSDIETGDFVLLNRRNGTSSAPVLEF